MCVVRIINYRNESISASAGERVRMDFTVDSSPDWIKKKRGATYLIYGELASSGLSARRWTRDNRIIPAAISGGFLNPGLYGEGEWIAGSGDVGRGTWRTH